MGTVYRKMGWVSHKYQASVVPFGALNMMIISVYYTTRWVEDRNASAFQKMNMTLGTRLHTTPTPSDVL